MKSLLLFASATVLIAGCASGPDQDQFLKQLNPPFWTSGQIHSPANTDNIVSGEAASPVRISGGTDHSFN